MKPVLTILIIAFFIVAIGGGAYYYFAIYKPSNEQTQTSSQQASQESISEEEYEEETGYSDCPEGVVCVGSDYVPALPEVTLGASEVYATEDDDEEPTEEKVETQLLQEETITDNTPQNILVTNKDFSAWSLVWVTDTPQTGYLLYGTNEESIDQKAYDDREVSVVNLASRYTHHVTVETELDSDQEVTYYFKIVSGDEEFATGGDYYSYENAPLTSSPSSPTSVSVTTEEDFDQSSEDVVVIARVIDADGNRSTSVSMPFNQTGGVDLPIGIVRQQNLNSYFSISDSSTLELKLYGPDLYTSYASDTEIGDETIDLATTKTGYRGDIYSQSYGFADPDGGQDQDPDDAPVETPDDPDTQLPRTGIEDSWVFTSVFGMVILLLGTFSGLLIIPWNFKRVWEKRVVEEVE